MVITGSDQYLLRRVQTHTAWDPNGSERQGEKRGEVHVQSLMNQCSEQLKLEWKYDCYSPVYIAKESVHYTSKIGDNGE